MTPSELFTSDTYDAGTPSPTLTGIVTYPAPAPADVDVDVDAAKLTDQAALIARLEGNERYAYNLSQDSGITLVAVTKAGGGEDDATKVLVAYFENERLVLVEHNGEMRTISFGAMLKLL